MRAIGYVRVSTAEQETAAQRHTIALECERRGWELVHIAEDAATSGKVAWDDRPGLASAIQRIESGDAAVLVCAKLDRLSRSVNDFSGLLERAKAKRWAICLLDFGLDMTTPVGELVANILIAVSQFERRRIGERTREGMAARKAAGHHMGRRSAVPIEIRDTIAKLRVAGLSYSAIAETLHLQGYPTPQGGKRWRDTSVRAVHRASQTDGVYN